MEYEHFIHNVKQLFPINNQTLIVPIPHHQDTYLAPVMLNPGQYELEEIRFTKELILGNTLCKFGYGSRSNRLIIKTIESFTLTEEPAVITPAENPVEVTDATIIQLLHQAKAIRMDEDLKYDVARAEFVNGLELALSIAEGRQPVYIEAQGESVGQRLEYLVGVTADEKEKNHNLPKARYYAIFATELEKLYAFYNTYLAPKAGRNGMNPNQSPEGR